uniref:Uncharacterized protein n=1 Tax=Oryzias latipes TaxID=8090 RepID=A0A3B3H8X0_ORYLA
HFPKSAIKDINQINFKFIWKYKTHYIRKSVMLTDYEEEGLKTIDVECLDGTIKINWLRSFLKNEKGFWYQFPSKILRDARLSLGFFGKILLQHIYVTHTLFSTSFRSSYNIISLTQPLSNSNVPVKFLGAARN